MRALCSRCTCTVALERARWRVGLGERRARAARRTAAAGRAAGVAASNSRRCGRNADERDASAGTQQRERPASAALRGVAARRRRRPAAAPSSDEQQRPRPAGAQGGRVQQRAVEQVLEQLRVDLDCRACARRSACPGSRRRPTAVDADQHELAARARRVDPALEHVDRRDEAARIARRVVDAHARRRARSAPRSRAHRHGSDLARRRPQAQRRAPGARRAASRSRAPAPACRSMLGDQRNAPDHAAVGARPR